MQGFCQSGTNPPIFRGWDSRFEITNMEMKMTSRRTILKSAVVAAGFAAAGLSAAAADELETLKEEGVIRIAMSGAYPPFNFVNDANEVVGFDPAVGTEIAKRMGLEAEIVTTAWDGIIGGLLAEKYDAIVGSMTITEERDKVWISSAPTIPTSARSSRSPDRASTASKTLKARKSA